MKGDLDKVIADGLGIDLAVVQKTSSQLGIVQALAQASVPVANPDGSKVLDSHGLNALRGALSTTLARVAAHCGAARPPHRRRCSPTVASVSERAASRPRPIRSTELIERTTPDREEEG